MAIKEGTSICFRSPYLQFTNKANRLDQKQRDVHLGCHFFRRTFDTISRSASVIQGQSLQTGCNSSAPHKI
jgi:hypothetical protein